MLNVVATGLVFFWNFLKKNKLRTKDKKIHRL